MRVLLLCSILLLLLTIHCKKKEDESSATTVQFRVTDYKTQQPLAGVIFSIFSASSNTVTHLGTDTSSSGGIVKVQLDSVKPPFFFNMTKANYVPRQFNNLEIKLDLPNEGNISMRRFDAVVRLEATNLHDTPDSLFFDLKNGGVIESIGEYAQQFPIVNPLALQPHQTLILNIPALGDDPATIRWSWDPATSISNIPFKSVVIPVAGDTLVYKVTN